MLDSDESRGSTSGLAPHLFRAAVLVTFALLATQLWRLQIVEGPQLRQRADNNRVRVSQITPPRGVIYDRKGTIVASNAPREDALLVEQDLANLPGVKVSVESARKYTDGRLLAHILGYLGPISPSVLSPAEYKEKIEKDGYTINDRIGAAGLEEQYESVMRGQPGRRMYEVEASGRPVNEIRVENPDAGRNLILSLDLDL